MVAAAAAAIAAAADDGGQNHGTRCIRGDHRRIEYVPMDSFLPRAKEGRADLFRVGRFRLRLAKVPRIKETDPPLILSFRSADVAQLK